MALIQISMRYIIAFFFFICLTFSSQAQSAPVNSNLGLDYILLDYVSQVKLSNNSYGEKYTGSFFLFDNWTNNCEIQLSGKLFKLNNVNFNVDTNEFMSEMGKDSVFSIDSKYVDFINIRGKRFIYKIYKGQNKFFEVLLKSEKGTSLFKGYNIRILPKSEMGMLNRPYDEIKKEEKYFITNGTELVNIKLKKKDILRFLEKDKQSIMLKHIKENKLSFKKEKDLKEIFKYYNSI